MLSTADIIDEFVNATSDSIDNGTNKEIRGNALYEWNMVIAVKVWIPLVERSLIYISGDQHSATVCDKLAATCEKHDIWYIRNEGFSHYFLSRLTVVSRSE